MVGFCLETRDRRCMLDVLKLDTFPSLEHPWARRPPVSPLLLCMLLLLLLPLLLLFLYGNHLGTAACYLPVPDTGI